MNASTFDIVIIGGGVMGCATAYCLLQKECGLRVAVVEKDPTYTRASSTLSMANVRLQFSLKENILISRYTLEVLRTFETDMATASTKPHIGFRPEGNLFLVTPTQRGAAETGLRLQQQLGADVAWWTPSEIKAHYPMYAPDAMAGATFGAQDGHLDAYAVLMAYRAKAKSMGAHFIDDRVTAVETRSGRVRGVQLAAAGGLTTPVAVNCAGAWAAQVADSAGVDLPVVPVKRQVFAVDPAVKPSAPLPLTVLPSGLYFRTETGGGLLVGKSMAEDPVGIDFTWDARRFHDILWMELAEFVPAFDTLKLVRGWAGLYAVNTLDGNAILGEWPELAGFYLANGFSGHGLQQAPAVGRYLAEEILGQPHALDLCIFSPRRILEKHPIGETGLV